MPNITNAGTTVEINYLTWSDYKIAHNLREDTSVSEMEFHRQQYRREYQRAYGRERRKQKHRIPTEWTKSEYRKLKHFADRYRKTTLNFFIKKCVLAYLEDEYVEHNEVLSLQLNQQVRAIGNNINQIVHALHISRDYSNRDYYLHLKNKVEEIRSIMEEHQKHPPKLREQLEQLFIQVPESIDDFQSFLDQMKAKHQGHDHQEH